MYCNRQQVGKVYCNTLLEGEVYCNGYCIAGAVGRVLQYKKKKKKNVLQAVGFGR